MADILDSLESPKMAVVLDELPPATAELIRALVRDISQLAAQVDQLTP